jgi:hypothetical protein
VQITAFFVLALFRRFLLAPLLVAGSAGTLNGLAPTQMVLINGRFLVAQGQFGILLPLLPLGVISANIHLAMLDIFLAIH